MLSSNGVRKMTAEEPTRNTEIIAYVLAHPKVPLEKVAKKFDMTRARVQFICRSRLVFRRGPFYYCRGCKKRIPVDPEKLRNKVQPDLNQFMAKMCEGCYRRSE